MKFLFYFLPFYFVLFTAGITYNREQVKESQKEVKTLTTGVDPKVTYPPFDDGLPKTPSIETHPLVNRLAKGIVNRKVNQEVWWECGSLYDTREYTGVALTYAHNIVRVSKKYRLNPWGIAATIAKESKFDRCAIGKYSREWARKRNFLKPRIKAHFRRTLSHPKEDIVNLLKRPEWKRSWRNVDIGAMQVLWPCYYTGPASDMLTLDPGLDIQARKMYDWSKFYKTTSPWAYWTGSRRSDIRHNTVIRIAKSLGAKTGEI